MLSRFNLCWGSVCHGKQFANPRKHLQPQTVFPVDFLHCSLGCLTGDPSYPKVSKVLASHNARWISVGYRFGWFGLNVQNVPSPILNYIGTAMAALSAGVLIFVKTESKDPPPEEVSPLMQDKETEKEMQDLQFSSSQETSPKQGDTCWTDNLNPPQKKLVGCSLAMCAGLLYGSSFVPVLYIKNHAERNEPEFFGASQFDMDYVFAYCSGIILTSTIYFLVYCGLKKNKPSVYSTAILPAFFSGLLWGIANGAWFLANYYLGAVITFPLVTAGPSVIALTWGVFYFKEIKGPRNFLILGVVLAIALCGTILIGLSKVEGIV
ncbi:transmembrane protein 144-like isoform X5 [Narcine bancroftii]|uniref:transmembrane protein 144-like isoform X5 n=1 Tax=Narcine bancroftii TaxID=1343680 RepID=UPI00383185B6